jgi:hypothetical protein
MCLWTYTQLDIGRMCTLEYKIYLAVMQLKSEYKRWPGLVWIILAPILLLMASISTVEPLETYYIQFWCFAFISVLGFGFGVAFLFRVDFARRMLIVLSWVGCLYFFGSAFFGVIYALFNPEVEHDISTVFILVGVMAVISLQGVPFYFMAKKVSQMSCSNA